MSLFCQHSILTNEVIKTSENCVKCGKPIQTRTAWLCHRNTFKKYYYGCNRYICRPCYHSSPEYYWCILKNKKQLSVKQTLKDETESIATLLTKKDQFHREENASQLSLVNHFNQVHLKLDHCMSEIKTQYSNMYGNSNNCETNSVVWDEISSIISVQNQVSQRISNKKLKNNSTTFNWKDHVTQVSKVDKNIRYKNSNNNNNGNFKDSTSQGSLVNRFQACNLHNNDILSQLSLINKMNVCNLRSDNNSDFKSNQNNTDITTVVDDDFDKDIDLIQPYSDDEKMTMNDGDEHMSNNNNNNNGPTFSNFSLGLSTTTSTHTNNDKNSQNTRYQCKKCKKFVSSETILVKHFQVYGLYLHSLFLFV